MKQISDDLYEALADYLRERQDVRDGSECTPLPNDAMHLLFQLTEDALRAGPARDESAANDLCRAEILLSKADDVLGYYWFDGSYNNDRVIDMSREIQEFLDRKPSRPATNSTESKEG